MQAKIKIETDVKLLKIEIESELWRYDLDCIFNILNKYLIEYSEDKDFNNSYEYEFMHMVWNEISHYLTLHTKEKSKEIEITDFKDTATIKLFHKSPITCLSIFKLAIDNYIAIADKDFFNLFADAIEGEINKYNS
jgi:hypothetical protein